MIVGKKLDDIFFKKYLKSKGPEKTQQQNQGMGYNLHILPLRKLNTFSLRA